MIVLAKVWSEWERLLDPSRPMPPFDALVAACRRAVFVRTLVAQIAAAGAP